MTDADLTLLKKKRTQLRTAVTKLITAIESELNKTDINCDTLEESIELLNDKFEHLNVTDSHIEKLLNPEDVDREFQNSEEYREKVIVCKFRASKRIKTNVSMNTPVTTIQNSEPTNSKSDVNIKENMNIRLPKLSIPQFSGDIDQWLSFWNSFEIAVHKNNSLDDVDKFNYLKAHLTGSALSTIEGFSLTKANYDSAIKLLEERFGKKDLLINAHMTSLLNIAPLRSSNDLKAFRKLFDHCQIQIRSLETLEVTSETYGKLLCPMLLKLLPPDLVLEFNKQKSNLDVNTLMNFLSGELQSRERTEAHRLGAVVPFTRQMKSNESSINNTARGVKLATAAEFMNKSKSVKLQNICIFCDKSHPSADCRLALRFPYEKRKQILTSKGACFKCLKPKHLARFCRTKISCTACNGQHLFIMCDSAKCPSPDNNNKNGDYQEQAENRECSLTNSVNLPEVFLQTLVVHIRGKNNKKLVRCLVDSGSQRSYISKYAATLMNYDNIGEEKICHSLFGGSEFLEEHKKYLVHLSSFNNKYHCNFEVLDQKTICSDISPTDISSFANELKKRKIFLTDTVHVHQDLIYENSPSEVHLLIGADIMGKLLTGRIEKLPSGLVCIETLLGWTITGKTDKINAEDRNNLALSLHVNNHCISHLWKLDTLGILDPGEAQSKREIEDASKEHFVRTVKRDRDGRYVVSLPWIEGHQILPNNKSVAEQRLKSVMKTLQNKDLVEAYENVFKQWLDEQIIEEVKPCELKKTNCHYLPHRAVIKERSTTKIRPVFDASAKDKTGISLNDCLTKGPNYIELIPSILNKFRLYEYGVIADIRKAFLQIGIRDEDRDFLRFLWWEGADPNNKKVFRHRRVVFGVNSSPFLLGAVLNYHLDNVPDYLQETASKLKRSMYVDNCVTSCKSKDELLNFIRQSKEIMLLACFDLRGWLYNGIQLETSETFTEDEKAAEVSEEILRDGIVPVLGLNWDISADVMLCNTNFNDYNDENLTKRVILSLASQLFDPIGFLCPVTLIPKVLMQECWRRKLSWDSKLPTDLEKKFLKWKRELKFVENVRIPRKMLNNSESETDLSWHVFCDASQHAYAACIFLRQKSDSDVKCHLVQARARVAPLKSVSIPRLELLACLVGVRLMSSIKKDFPFNRIPIFYWTDSMNALYWIRKQECWTVFVMNRVNEIRSGSTPESWNFVPGTMNPADLPSRGCSAKELARTKWWEGPQWLKNSIEEWPKSEILPNLDIIEREKRKSVVSSTNTDSFSKKFYDNFSSYEKIVTIIAWIYRFYQNCKLKKENRLLDNLSVSERNHAEFTLIRNIQSEVFSGHEDKCLRNLQAFTDNYGIIRIRTRILRRDDEENFRFPVVLPSKHPLVEKLIRHEHEKMNHAGVQFLISSLREKFWILKARKTIRQVVRKCVRCLRYDGKFKKSPIAPIIEDRVRDAAIFEIVGIDLAGPLILKHNQKTWIVVFTCAVFRAVHLELCTSLSTESFLQSLRRFIARRGRPYVIYSDNGTNFVGTSNLFKTINWETVSREATINKIQWKFIPPSAPWWGGWWERLIGILKRILRKVLGRTSLNYDELSTILCECESIMNNRPLTYMSDDVEDLTPLTPSMFLHEIRETGVPDFDQLDTSSLNRRLIYRQKLKQNLLVRFRSEYLGQLRQNYQHIKEDKPVEVGDLVLVSSDNLKRIGWPLGRIMETFKSKDGHVRLAKVRTSGGEILRPVARLLPLEINSVEEYIRPQANMTLKPSGSQPDVSIDEKVPVQDSPIVTTRHGRIAILCLPLLRAKDLYPFLDDSLLKLEEKGTDSYEEEVHSQNLLYDSFEDQSGEDSGWTEWGPWMTCSRSCDGGIAISLRKCRGGRCPQGEPIRRQICNMQPCSEPTDFRAAQCSAYNNRPYRGRLYRWLPFHDPEDPCVLACQADGFGFVAKHSKKVHDGTRCREGALDMCVEGRCQPIGCDLRVGSTLKVDECGVCGGDGSQCHRPTFVWNEGTFGACSVTCGGGIQLSEATCRNKETNEEVDPRLCNLSIRPRTKAMHCNREPCPVVWETGEWGPCSATCGPGVQSRPAFCVQGGPNGSRIDVKTQFCPAHKPQTERSCVVEECPRWFQGAWTPCSVTCGHGIQTRAVVCRDTKNQYSENCDLSEMPRPQRPCDTRIPCPTPPTDDGSTPQQPCVYTPSTEDDLTTTEEATTEMEPVIMLTEAPQNLTEGAGPMYFVGPWGRCNGQGFRQRAVYCRVFIEMSKTAARLPDSQCTDARPTDVEPCAISCAPIFPPREVVAPVIEVDQIESEDLEPEKMESFHSWNTEKFSPCSASCGGGLHTSLVRCLRLPDQVEVSPQLCDPDMKPEPLTKRCNQQPCPVRWSVSEFGNCSRECGGGIRSRLVKCIQVENEEESPYSQCSGLPPKAAENCNVFDCPAQWKTEPWSKCSKTCDGGFQTRKLLCEKILAPLSQAVLLPPSKCVKTRPKAVKKCNLKPCPPPPTPRTTTTTTTTPASTTATEEEETALEGQIFDQKYPNRRVNLKASGRAILFKGSNAKFHCPLHVNGSRVLWFKGHLRIPPSTTNGWPRVAVSGKGALRIHKVAFGDEGTYTCLAGAFRSDVELMVKPLPPRQPEFFIDSSSVAATTPTPSTPSRKVTYRSALPQVRHFLVNLRHFEEEHLQSDPVVLEYDWVVGPWSQCSQTCGENVMQVRTADCRVRVLSNATRIVARGLCVDGGLPEPTIVRPCVLDPCPEWITSEWSECSSKNCLSWNTAYQKRSVLCGVSNRTITPSYCDSRKRPRRKKECHNVDCRGTWKVSQWTKCTATCGNKGFQTRGVQCVWHGSQDPAPSSACKGATPQTSMACGRVPCYEEDEEDCFDQSTYCSVVKKTKLCEISQFRLQCCASCNKK